MKKLLFSVTINDCDVETFCTGGNGGSHRNAKQNGVRITHRASGAVAEHRDGREQVLNKRTAFVKLVASPQFRQWHQLEIARRLGLLDDINDRVDASIETRNLKLEVFAKDRWTPWDVLDLDGAM